MVEVVALTGPLADSGEDGEAAMSLGNIVLPAVSVVSEAKHREEEKEDGLLG
jgi:presenilin-like A22 family membrane protease